MARITKQEYAREANAWRHLAVAFLLATRKEVSRRFNTPKTADGLCLATGDAFRAANNDVYCGRSVERMDKRLAKCKPRRTHNNSYWFDQRTQEGRLQRVQVALKLAAQCDKLARDK